MFSHVLTNVTVSGDDVSQEMTSVSADTIPVCDDPSGHVRLWKHWESRKVSQLCKSARRFALLPENAVLASSKGEMLTPEWRFTTAT